MANPQKENGYTPIANELLEHIVKCSFNGTQYAIILVIMRYTYGFNRKSHDISLNFLCESLATEKKNKRNIQRELQKLIDLNVIHIHSEATFNRSRELAVNKNYESWKVEYRQLTAKPSSDGEYTTTTDGELVTTTDGEITTTTDGELDNQERKIKDNIKTNLKKDILSVLPEADSDGDSNDHKQNHRVDYKALMETFNSTCSSLPPIREMSKKRQEKVRVFLKNQNGDKKKLLELFQKTEKSDFLTGRNEKFTSCGFDWIINYNNAIKILDGNYDNKRGSPPNDNSPPVKKNRFANFEQRKNDYEYLEKMEQEYNKSQVKGSNVL